MSWELDIENIAGIYQGSAQLVEGTNAVRASNWQGKSSLLSAIRTAMGVEKTLTEGEEEGHVTLQADGETFDIRLARQNGSVARSGTPYLTDEYEQSCASLFAFLDERNEIRRAVRAGDDLGEILTRPLDLQDIDQQIADLREERDSVDRELERAREKANQLASVQRRVTSLEEELDELEAQQEELEDGGDDDLAAKREELSDLRVERERVTDLVERLENTVERTQQKIEEYHDELGDLDVPENPQIEQEIADVTEELEEKERERELLQSIYSVTERFLEEDKLELLGEVEHGLIDDTYECWVCGGEVTESQVRDRLDTIGDMVVDLREEVNEHEERIEELKERRDEIRQARRRKDDLESEITSLEADLADREDSLFGARDRLEVIEDQIDSLEDEVEDADEQKTDLQSEIKYKRAELEDAREELEECERASEHVDLLEAERAELAEEITALRERKERMREQLRTEFDEAIKGLIDQFDTSFESARLTPNFELVIARDGRQISRDALSEGELELLGIVTALAGFETYDVADHTPMILLDEIGALADQNVQNLVNYLDDRARFLVLTVYPENTAFEDNEISPSDWKVVPPASEAVTA